MARKFLNGVDVTGTAVITAVPSTAGNQTVLRITGAADTGQTGATEKIDVDFALNRTVQWATGTLATQRAVVLRAPTYSFVGASVITNAATLAITGSPIAGANATITNTYAFWVQSGISSFDGLVNVASGSAAGPGLAFSGDTDTGIYAVGANSLGIAAGGTLRFSVSDTVITSTLINVLPATTTGSASLRMPHGTAPTTPVDGDLWSTTTGVFSRVNGVTVGPFGASGGTVTSVGLSVPAFLSVTGSPVTSSGTLAVTFSGTAIPLANGGTGSTAFTAGSVVFSNGTILTQDNANLFWDNTNKRLGIGVTGPTYPVDIAGKLRSSNGYILGADISLLPISGTQSAVTTWWGMQLVGNKQSPVDYGPSAIGGAGDFSVIIPNQQAGAIGLIIRGQTAQTGNLLELRNVSNTGLSAFNAAGRLGIGTAAPTSELHVVQAVATTGSPTGLLFTGGAHTTLTASTEASDVTFNLARTVQFATGALTNQRAFRIQAPTNSFVGASTITFASTLSISGAPVAGTNATHGASAALNIESGNIWVGTMGGTFGNTSGRIIVASGNVSLPAIAFCESGNAVSDTGFFGIADGQIGVTTNGALCLSITPTQFTGAIPWCGQDGTAGVPALSFNNDNNTGIYRIGTDSIGFAVNGALSTTIQTTSTQTSANVNIAPALVAAGAPCAFRVATPADTAQTAATEASSFIIDLAATRQWAGGALATQRAVRISAPTYAFVSGSIITNAATFAIAGAPIAGTNATITNSMSLWIQAGMARFDGVAVISTGSAAAPGLSPFGDSDTGVFSAGANAWGISAGGTLRLTVSDTAITSALINVLAASTTSAASLRMTHGTAPTSPVDGDEWSTTAGRFARINGVTTNLSRLVTALTDAATIAVNAATGDVFTVTLGGNRTMGAPTNPVNGRLMMLRIRQDATGSRTITWDVAFAFTTSMPAPTLSTVANRVDYVGFVYDSTSAKWHCVSYVLGHT